MSLFNEENAKQFNMAKEEAKRKSILLTELYEFRSKFKGSYKDNCYMYALHCLYPGKKINELSIYQLICLGFNSMHLTSDIEET